MTSELESSVQTTLLLVNLPGGSERAWAIFKRRFEPVIEGHCRRMGLKPGDVGEMAQVVLVKLFRGVQALASDPKREFRSWLKVVVENSVRDYWRQQRRRQCIEYDTKIHDVVSPGIDVLEEMARDLGEVLEKDCRALGACERVKGRVQSHVWQAFWLRAVDNLKSREVAAQLEVDYQLTIPIATVDVYKSRVLKMIRDEMGLDS